MPRIAEPDRIETLDALAPAFREDVDIVIAAITEQRLPLVVHETRRTIDRQNWLFIRGQTSQAGDESPYVWGCAVRFVLDPAAIHWKCIHAHPRGEWDTGIEWDGRHCRIERSHVADVLARAGAIVAGLGLTWGGRNGNGFFSPRPGDLFGRDPFHVQATKWKSIADRMRG